MNKLEIKAPPMHTLQKCLIFSNKQRYGLSSSKRYVPCDANTAANYAEQIRYRANKTRNGGKMGACEVPYANADFYESYDQRSSKKIIVNGLHKI